jgi:transcriptional regulator with XRE-family HTH domain
MEKSIFTVEHRRLQELLRQIRLGAGLRQEDLAALLGKDQGFISRCESGDRRLDLIELRRICQAVGITLSEFVKRFEESLS